MASKSAARKKTAVQSSMIRFGADIEAVRALPRAKGKRPGVIILHERYGIDQHTKDLTVKLAQAGFVGLARDLFHRFTGDRKAVLRGEQRVDLTDDGALGGREWQANELRPTPIEELIAQVTCPVLGVFGEADHIISVDDVARFRDCLEKAKKNYHVRLYRDAPHGWLNDTMPGRYRREAAKDAWSLMMAFLKKSFAGGWDPGRISWTFESDYSAKYDFTKNVRLE